MNIGGVQIGFGEELEDKISLNIYLSGCKNNKRCNMKLCHNQDLRNFDYGKDYREFFIYIKKILNSSIIDAVCFLGGEPLDQEKKDMLDFISFITSISKIPLYIYSGYDSIDIYYDYLSSTGISGVFFGSYNGKESKKQFLKFGEII